MTTATARTPTPSQPPSTRSPSPMPHSLDPRSDRLRSLPPFLFDEIDRKKRERIAAGADIINLGVGDPDQPTPEFIVEAMNRAMRDLVNQQYPAVGGGLKVFREAAANFMLRRFGVKVDPFKHIVCCIGSKDGISHLPLAVTNPGDIVLVPDPAYPVYEIGADLAECRVVRTPISAATRWQPDFDSIPAADAGAARLLWLNYPSNPTAASCDADLYERAIDWAAPTWNNSGPDVPPGRQKGGSARGCILCSDVAYSELYFEHKPVSLWNARNADIDRTPAIEFHSLSKTFNMTGWRIGFAVGHPAIIAALASIKANMDSGVFNAIQAAGAVALDRYDDPEVERMRRLYRERRDVIVPGLRDAGCEVEAPKSGFFVWARTPLDRATGKPIDSLTYAGTLLEKADTVVVPGAGFGHMGRDYIRIALTVPADRMRQAVDRLRSL